MENSSNKALYLIIFNLCPLGQIKNLVSDSNKGILTVIPKNKFETSIKIKVPEFVHYQGHSHCTDIMKFLVTS